MKNIRKENGITLIALIITVIILLILAGVAISSLGNSGLFSKSKDAVNKYAEAEKNEAEKLNEYLNFLNENESVNTNYIVNIPDIKLREAITKELLGMGEIPNDPLMKSDMLKLEVLTRPHYAGVTIITGIEEATNLKSIMLHGNNIVDIKPLANLKKLEELWISENKIVDISSLSNLTNLNCLELNNNQIIDITSLSNLTNLTTLYLQSNQISNFSPILHLKDKSGVNVEIDNNPGTW